MSKKKKKTNHNKNKKSSSSTNKYDYLYYRECLNKYQNATVKDKKAEKGRIRTAIAEYLIFFLSGMLTSYLKQFNVGSFFGITLFSLNIVFFVLNIYNLNKNITNKTYVIGSRIFQWVDIAFIFFSACLIYSYI